MPLGFYFYGFPIRSAENITLCFTRFLAANKLFPLLKLLSRFGIHFLSILTIGFPYPIQFPHIYYLGCFQEGYTSKAVASRSTPKKVFDIILNFSFYHSFAFQCSLSCSAMVSTPIAVRRVGYAPSYIHCSFALNRLFDSLKAFPFGTALGNICYR